jgi:hypothetical protein
MIQDTNDLFITSSAHAETPPHPDRLRRSDLSPQAGRGEPTQTCARNFSVPTLGKCKKLERAKCLLRIPIFSRDSPAPAAGRGRGWGALCRSIRETCACDSRARGEVGLIWRCGASAVQSGCVSTGAAPMRSRRRAPHRGQLAGGFDLISFALAEAPPHPEPSLRSDSDLSPQAGRGDSVATFSPDMILISKSLA